MNENLDLIKILKDCPKGTELYSPIVGTIYLFDVTNMFIRTIKSKESCSSQKFDFYSNGTFYYIPDAECMLFPSKDNRDWSTFKVPNKLPKTWEEFCENNPVTEKECWITMNSDIQYSGIGKRVNQDKNLLPNKEYAEAMLALCQLIQLRDCYNDGWKPDWNENEYKYCIEVQNNKSIIENWYNVQRVLVFKTKELCNEFFNNFKDLIEIAKPLL